MKTLLLGLDGATFSILDPLMQDGTMPFLKGLAENGVRANLLSTPNPLTPPAWTSMITGRSPGHHGIFDFLRPEETEDGIYAKLLDSRDIQCETIWSMISLNQRKAISLNFPVMTPPQPLAGYMVPGFTSWKHLRRGVYPKGLFEELKGLPSFDAREFGWDMDKEQKAVQALPESEYENWIQYHIRRERQWFEITNYLMNNKPYDLMGIVFDGVDKLQHLCWPLLDPDLAPNRPTLWEEKIHSLCMDYFHSLDGFLAQIVALAGEETRIFVASDHGFGPTWDIFYLNAWLQQQGYLEWSPKGAAIGDSEDMFGDGLSAQRFDWDKTVAYALTPSSNGIHIRVAERAGEPGIKPGEYEAFRNQLIYSLLNFKDPETDEAIVTKVMTREQVFSGAQMRFAPDLTLVLRDQGFISVVNSKTVLRRRKVAKGMHRPEGVLIAAGPGIKQGTAVEPMSILEICPLLLYSLGLEIPEDLERRPSEEIFEKSFMKNHPPRIGKPTQKISPEKKTDFISKEEENTMLSQLKALGYVE